MYPCFLFSGSKFNASTNVGEITMFKLPFIKGDWGNTSAPNSKYEVKEVYDTLSIQGVTYNNVAKVYINNCLLYDGSDMNFYWVQGHGLIKWENISDNESWELVYNVITK